jgi:ubiquinol-cytochrome c reductase cytochrome c subunit
MTDDDVTGESFDSLNFSVSARQTGTEGVPPARAARPIGRRKKGGLRRRLVGGVALLIALMAMGGVYSAFAQASTSGSNGTGGNVTEGRQLFSVSCITCHGANLDGVNGKGVSLIGVGSAATYFQVSTGRMPLVGHGAEADRKPTIYTEDQIEALSAYVQSVAGGPSIPQGSLKDDANLAEGGTLFRLNCAACHNFAGKGAPLSAGKIAPSLNESTPAQIYAAMLTGPENMPVFSDNQLTPDQKKSIISYVKALQASNDPGGAALDRVGPVTEGLVIWIVGIGALMVVILWIGAKS